jgi:integrase
MFGRKGGENVMPHGACVIKRRGKRGVVWYVKYRDADGRQVKERLGSELEGWNRRKAAAELRARLTAVEKEGLRRIDPTTFAAFGREWLETYPDLRDLKRSTREGYRSIIERHFIPVLGTRKIDTIDAGDLDRYVAGKRRAGLGPRTINTHLNLLNELFVAAAKRRPPLVRTNPVPVVDRPREPRRRWRILTPAEIARIERAFEELIAEANGEEHAWRDQARLLFLVIIATGLRRGEVLGLRWREVCLADPDGPYLRVAETWVRRGVDTPKSEAGERTISLGPRLAAELFEHRRRKWFVGDDERVFCSPTKGTALDAVRFAKTFRLALHIAGIEDRVRPFHDLRHTSITNAAAAGTSPAALMARAGHSDFRTTQVYIDLAGERFRQEAERLERRLWGSNGYQNWVPNRAFVAKGANGPVAEPVGETNDVQAVSRVRSGAGVEPTQRGAATPHRF